MTKRSRFLFTIAPLVFFAFAAHALADESANLYAKMKDAVVKLEINELGVD